MSKKVNLNSFASEVIKITEDYVEEVTDSTEAAVMKTAFKAEGDLHVAGDFENRSGKYRRGWTVTFNQLRYGLEAVVHNKVYMLTHLLESGHSKWLWGRPTGEDVRAFEHIEKVNEEAQKMLQEEIQRSLQ